jgi:hypothetical protein
MDGSKFTMNFPLHFLEFGQHSAENPIFHLHSPSGVAHLRNRYQSGFGATTNYTAIQKSTKTLQQEIK